MTNQPAVSQSLKPFLSGSCMGDYYVLGNSQAPFAVNHCLRKCPAWTATLCLTYGLMGCTMGQHSRGRGRQDTAREASKAWKLWEATRSGIGPYTESTDRAE